MKLYTNDPVIHLFSDRRKLTQMCQERDITETNDSRVIKEP